MFWLIVIGIVLIVVFSISGASKRTSEAQARAEFAGLAQSRAVAYADYLKRTSRHPAVLGMTDHELRDYLQTHIRQYQAERKGVSDASGWIAGGGFFLGVFLGLGAESFIVWIVVFVASLVLAGARDKNRTQLLDRKYRQMGLDPGQLHIGS